MLKPIYVFNFTHVKILSRTSEKKLKSSNMQADATDSQIYKQL